jgi:hypothetical protein
MKRILITLGVLACGLLVPGAHGQKRKAPSDAEAILLGDCAHIRSNHYRLKCYDYEARRQQALEDLNYRRPRAVEQTMTNSPGGVQEAGDVSIPRSGTLIFSHAPSTTVAATFECPREEATSTLAWSGCTYERLSKATIYLDVMKGLKTVEFHAGARVETINVDEVRARLSPQR